MDVSTHARIAIYDDLLSSPRVIEVGPAPVLDFIESIASTTYSEARALGGSLPYTVIREIAENFIHASFKECTVSLLDRGNTISFSDQGPGIEKKHLVQQPGVTSATAEMKRFIKGVGSGFPVVKEYLQFSRGHLTITDNALEGTVVTLSIETERPPVDLSVKASPSRIALESAKPNALPHSDNLHESNLPGKKGHPHDGARPATKRDAPQAFVLSDREIQALLLTAELGAIGPSDLVDRLDLSMPTISRLLKTLEQRGFLEPVAHRKRILSNAGLHCLQEAGLWQ
ncbi:MAG: MarR family transcriptional regulator [Coriobacteriales bacterium]|jgi:ribosomal protein S25|nr:MarR family transcriptional regulator [Coriobacteriales bacterium]